MATRIEFDPLIKTTPQGTVSEADRIALQGVTIVGALGTIIQKGWKAFWSKFPDPFGMLDEFLRVATSLVGAVLTSGLQTQLLLIQAQIQSRGLHNKLIRVDDAVSGFFGTYIEFVKQVTFTSESGLFEWLLQKFAMWLYRTVKQVRLISGLIQSRTAEQFADVVIQSWKQKLSLLRVVGLVVAIVSVVGIVGFALTSWIFSWNFGVFKSFILPQDSARVWRRGFQHRVNKRTGPDTI